MLKAVPLGTVYFGTYVAETKAGRKRLKHDKAWFKERGAKVFLRTLNDGTVDLYWKATGVALVVIKAQGGP